MHAGRSDPTNVQRTSEVELVITRSFRAPAQIVFDAWTRPELVRRWWAPASRGVTLVQCEADVRPGGSYRYVMARNDETMAFSGRYLEVQPPFRLVYTQAFEPVPGETMITVSLEEQQGITTLVAREVYPNREALQAALQSGMEDGMRDTMHQLDALLGSQAR